MRHDVRQILGMVVMVAFGQGLVRLLFGDDERGLLPWLPGGFAPALLAYSVLTAAGALLAARGYTRARALGRRE
ncbi:hypothetical protein ACIBSV_09055 [Embleya sp. NPDC050154]|uniref:hypothetical protein n=1 Tax=unclassified Embleya TaxID=2699296 RepID=UPI0037A89F7C